MFQELVYAYQNSVLAADQEVEDGLVNSSNQIRNGNCSGME